MRDIVDQIVEERWRQDGQWGGPAHDDEHDQVEWKRLIHRQLLHSEDFEKMMVKVAALAIAAIQSNRRKHETDSRQG